MAHYEKTEFTNMCMIYDGEGNVLVQDRKNPQWPGIAFPGGHVDEGESFSDAVCREVLEETGLAVEAPELCGIKHFQYTDEAGEKIRYVVMFYKSCRFSGTLRSSCEGEVFWVKRSELMNMSLAPNFADSLEIFEGEKFAEMYWYREKGELKKRVI